LKTQNFAKLHVTKAPLTITTPNTYTYGDKPFTVSATASSGLSVEYTSSNDKLLKINKNQATILGAGTVKITATQKGDTSYLPAQTEQMITINKAKLQCFAHTDVRRAYGDANQRFSISYEGFVYQDNIDSIDKKTIVVSHANLTSVVGIYSTNIVEGSDNNYELKTQNFAKLYVTKAPLSITADHAFQIENGAMLCSTFKIIGLKNNETETVLDSTVKFKKGNCKIQNCEWIPYGVQDNNYEVVSYISDSITSVFPPSMRVDWVTDITDSTAVVYSEVQHSGFSPVYERGVCWSTHEKPTVIDNISTNGSGVGKYHQKITGLKPNQGYYIRAYGKNIAGAGYGDFYGKLYELYFHTTAISEKNSEDGISVFPNPSDGRFTVRLDNEKSEQVEIKIYSFDGKIIFDEKYDAAQNFRVSVKAKKGLYMLKIVMSGGVLTRKILVE